MGPQSPGPRCQSANASGALLSTKKGRMPAVTRSQTRAAEMLSDHVEIMTMELLMTLRQWLDEGRIEACHSPRVGRAIESLLSAAAVVAVAPNVSVGALATVSIVMLRLGPFDDWYKSDERGEDALRFCFTHFTLPNAIPKRRVQ